ncbi:MAG: cysteine--tRNA ligase [Oligoflexales bacterium]
MREVKVTNTLTRTKEVLKPLTPGEIKIYACGVTVYDHCHIGHAMQAIYFDAIRTYLEYIGYKVTYVRNFTDVDDKIIDRAQRDGISPLTLSANIIESSTEDMAALGVRPADFEPKVSDTIPEIIAMTEDLIRNGFAYVSQDGDVYYRVRHKKDYGKLSNQSLDDMKSGSRSIHAGAKEDELDFALWKKSDVEGATWPSPWGKGRPGWHIECSAMSKKFLGAHFDIHGGGRDLVFPHHENEIAQSEAANGEKFANYWLHSGLLTINKQKMSKSLGNHILIKEFLKTWPVEVLRLAYLLQHYTSNTDFSQAVFQNCAKRLLYFYETLLLLDEYTGSAKVERPLPEMTEKFHAAMCDDFNTSKAIADMGIYFKAANEVIKKKKTPATAQEAATLSKGFRELFNILGLLKENPVDFINSLKDKIIVTLGITKKDVENFIAQRNEARKNKDYALSDSLRSQLLEKGITLKDTATGTDWTVTFNIEG